MLVVVARQLGEVMPSYRALLKERLTVTQWLGKGAAKAYITIREKVFPGVVMQIGNLQQETTDEIRGQTFWARSDQIVGE